MHIRHHQYWQIAYPKSLVAQNGIKKRSTNKHFYLRKLSQFLGQFTSNALVIQLLCLIYLCTIAIIEYGP